MRGSNGRRARLSEGWPGIPGGLMSAASKHKAIRRKAKRWGIENRAELIAATVVLPAWIDPCGHLEGCAGCWECDPLRATFRPCEACGGWQDGACMYGDLCSLCHGRAGGEIDSRSDCTAPWDPPRARVPAEMLAAVGVSPADAPRLTAPTPSGRRRRKVVASFWADSLLVADFLGIRDLYRPPAPTLPPALSVEDPETEERPAPAQSFLF